MPIRIATVGRQKSVASLARALFETKGSPELQARAEEELLRANPSLAATGGLKSGDRIFVPSAPELTRSKSTESVDEGIDVLVALTLANAEALEDSVDGPVTRLAEDAKAGAAEAKAIIGRLAASRPKLKELGPEITKNAAGEGERIRNGADAIRAAVEALRKDLEVGDKAR